MPRAEILHWNPSDYLSDFKTGCLSLEEEGAYRRLLDHMWTGSDEQCTFPLDYRVLGSIWKVSTEDAERLVDALTGGRYAVLRVKETTNGAFLHSKRLQEQKRLADSAREKQVKAGRKSGAVRRANAMNAVGTPLERRSFSGSNTNEDAFEQETNPRISYHVSRNTYLVGGVLACLEAELTLDGKTASAISHIWSAAEELYGPSWPMVEVNRGALLGMISDGCLAECSGDCAQAQECAIHIIGKMRLKDQGGWAKSKRLLGVCLREDREQVRV